MNSLRHLKMVVVFQLSHSDSLKKSSELKNALAQSAVAVECTDRISIER